MDALRRTLGTGFIDAFRVYAMKISAFVARAGIDWSSTHGVGPIGSASFNFFAVDWVVEQRGSWARPHFLEVRLLLPLLMPSFDSTLHNERLALAG